MRLTVDRVEVRDRAVVLYKWRRLHHCGADARTNP